MGILLYISLLRYTDVEFENPYFLAKFILVA